MITPADIVAVADAYAAALGISEKTVSSRVFGDSKKLRALRDGGDLLTSRARLAFEWFSAHWPDSAEWPAGVGRLPAPDPPSPSPSKTPFLPSADVSP